MELGITAFSRRLGVSQPYVSKLVREGIIRLTPNGLIDPRAAITRMRQNRAPVRISKINLTGYCRFCEMPQDENTIGGPYCRLDGCGNIPDLNLKLDLTGLKFNDE